MEVGTLMFDFMTIKAHASAWALEVGEKLEYAILIGERLKRENDMARSVISFTMTPIWLWTHNK